MPINPTPAPTKAERTAKRWRAFEGWLNDHADILATFLMGLMTGYILAQLGL